MQLGKVGYFSLEIGLKFSPAGMADKTLKSGSKFHER